MPISSSKLAESLKRNYLAFEGTRRKVDKLATKRIINRLDAERVYEGLFLNAHVAFEGFLGSLFIGLLISNGGVESTRSDIIPRVIVKSHKIAREIVRGPISKYVDWLPYDRTIALAEIFFQGARPFSELTDGEKKILSNCHTIRNAISHKSRFSMQKFEQVILGNQALPPQERSPAGYLRGLFRRSPSQTRYENLGIDLLNIAIKLAR